MNTATDTTTVPGPDVDALLDRLEHATRLLNLASMLLEHSTDGNARRDETIANLNAQLDQRDAALEELSGQYERMRDEVKRLRRELREADATIEWHAQAEGLS